MENEKLIWNSENEHCCEKLIARQKEIEASEKPNDYSSEYEDCREISKNDKGESVYVAGDYFPDAGSTLYTVEEIEYCPYCGIKLND